MMTVNPPLVSIGMPLHNEEQYLRESLDCLLAQDYANFELVISDNASTDATAQICQVYGARDRRIRYFRCEKNLGAVENFNRVFRLSSGKYFMWASGNDLRAPTFISRCLEIMEADPSVVVCFPRMRWIAQDGKLLDRPTPYLDTRNATLLRRFTLALWQNMGVYNSFYGLIRSEALPRTPFHGKAPGPDCLLLVELSVTGSFANVPECLFYARQHGCDGENATHRASRNRHFNTLYARSRTPLLWVLIPKLLSVYEQLRVVQNADVGASQRFLMGCSVLIAYFIKYYRWMPAYIRGPLRRLAWRLFEVRSYTDLANLELPCGGGHPPTTRDNKH